MTRVELQGGGGIAVWATPNGQWSARVRLYLPDGEQWSQQRNAWFDSEETAADWADEMLEAMQSIQADEA